MQLRWDTNRKLLLAIGMMAIVFALDWVEPEGYAIWLAYLFPVLIAALAGQSRYALVITATCTVLIGLGSVLSPDKVEPHVALINRALDALLLWIIAILAMQRRQAEEQTEGLARFPSENPNPVIRLDQTGTLLYANEASDVLLREWKCQVGSRVPKPFVDLVTQALSNRSRNIAELDYAGQVYLFVVVPIVETGYVNFYVMNITERKRAQQERERVLQELAAIEERQRLARELHDAVSQSLFSASIIADILPRLWRSDPEEAQRRLAELSRLTRGAQAEMRSLLLELRPAGLVEKPLGDLLEQLGTAVSGRARLPVNVEVQGDGHLLPDVQVSLYRITQEALNNIAKHARATQVEIKLRLEPERAELCISDDGRGFEQDSFTADHMGLRNMRERAESIGAQLSIESQVGQGTRIQIRWPGAMDKSIAV